MDGGRPPKDDPPLAPTVEQRPVTRESLAENDRRQAVYAARRRSWTEAQLRRSIAPEPDPEPRFGEAERQAQPEGRMAVPAKPLRPRSSVIHDKRQTRLDL